MQESKENGHVDIDVLNSLFPKRSCLTKRIKKMVKLYELKTNPLQSDIPGFSYIFERERAIWSRLFWFLVLTICIMFCCYQCLERLEYYLSYPVAVDVHLLNNDSILFPGTAICFGQTRYLVRLLKKYNHSQDGMCVGIYSIRDLTSIPGIEIQEIWKKSDPVIECYQISTSVVKKPLRLPWENERQYHLLDLQDQAYFYNFSFRRLNTPFGSCLIAKNMNPIKYAGYQRTFIEIIFQNPPPDGCFQSSIVYGAQESESQIDPTALAIMSSGIRTEITIFPKIYKFLDRPDSPCTDTETYHKCVRDCQQKTFRKIADCRFPFMDEDSLPECQTSEVTRNMYVSLLRVYLQLNPSVDCKCIRKCEETVYEFSQQLFSNKESYTIMKFSVFDNNILMFNERALYDIIALLCDVGGNLGLYLGLSVLSVFNIFYQMREKWGKKRIEYDLTDPIYRKVIGMYESIKRSSKKNQIRDNKSIFSIVISRIRTVDKSKLLFLLFSFTYCSILICTRIFYYFQIPTNTIVKVLQNVSLEFPNITTCGESADILKYRKKLGKYLKKNFCDVNMLDLLDIPSITPEILWNKSNIERQFVTNNMKLNQDEVDVSYLNLPDGACYHEKIGRRTFAGLLSFHSHTYILQANCGKQYQKIYFTTPFEQFNYLNYRYIPIIPVSGTIFKINMAERMSTPQNPCVDKDIFYKCQSNCVNQKLRKLIKCWLPYMNDLNLTACNSSASAKEAQSSYLAVVYSTNPIEECHCTRKCEDSILTSRMYTEPLETAIVNFIGFMYQYNFIEVYKEIPGYSFEKLLCDIGGNLGLALGASVMLMLDVFQNILNVFFS